MYLTKDEFLQKFGILPQEFEEADISWEELLEIADDYERRRPTLEKIRKEFVAEFLQDKEYYKLYALCDRPDRNPGTFAVSGGLGKLP